MSVEYLISLLAIFVALFSVVVARHSLKASIRRQWINDVHLSLINLIAGCKRIINHNDSADDIELMHRLSVDFWKVQMLLGNDKLERDLKGLVSTLFSVIQAEINEVEKTDKANILCSKICELSNKLYKKSVLFG